MNNWEILSEEQSSLAWDYIYTTMKFRPRGTGKLIEIPQPCEYYNIAQYYNAGFREDYYDDLHKKTKQVFRSITGRNERMLALNWQHDCYSFDPRLKFQKDEFGEWLIPVFPNGDYIFFLTQDFSNGVFGDGINLYLSLFGKKLIESFKMNHPRILNN
jgi:hypothetical protein